jgi:micrococcal nuclease|tara:strand:- start:1245 stop:1694 length:450 start_codon:yes stop_codon:yes gene_type:complete
MYEYKCKILRIIDGDTVDVDIDLGFGIWMHKERVRMMGIDTPESRTRDKVEKKFGLASKKRLKDMLPVGSAQILKTQIARDGEDAKGKFGRILGDFIVHYTPEDRQTKASEIMILEGYAVAYHGQNKEDVEQEHLNNRTRLIKEKKVVL